jgi:diguanylate cyclase (GGDEF)-like protein/PAS domain S-box-containing protein
MRRATSRAGTRRTVPSVANGAAPIRVLVVSDIPDYHDWVHREFAASPMMGDEQCSVAIEQCAPVLSATLDALYQALFDAILLDAGFVERHGECFLADLSAAAPLAVVLGQRSRREEDNDGAVQTDHLILQSGLLGDWVPKTLNLACLPSVLGFALRRNEALATARNCRAQLDAMCSLAPSGMLIVDDEGRQVYSNTAFRRLTGQGGNRAACRQTWCTAVHPDDRDRVAQEWRHAANLRQAFVSAFRLLGPTGEPVPVRARGRVIHADPLAEDYALMAFTMEETAVGPRDRAPSATETALIEERARLSLLLDSISQAVIVTDLGGNVTLMNPAAEQLTGWTNAEAAGQPANDILRLSHAGQSTPDEDALDMQTTRTAAAGALFRALLISRQGNERLIEVLRLMHRAADGHPHGTMILFHDQAPSRAVAERMIYLAHHDSLTGLANRALLEERSLQAIRLAERHGKQLAFIYMDIDNFKAINDSLGHAAGDQLLQTVGDRLTRCVRSTDTICRYGGDEFVALLAEVEQPGDALQVADKMIAALGAPCELGDQSVRVSLSAGISVFPMDGQQTDKLLMKADEALFAAKRLGRDRSVLYGKCDAARVE